MASVARWAAWAAFLCLASAAPAPASPASLKLIEALDAATAEDDARSILAPHLDSLKTVDSQVVEKVVMRQWWGLARDIVAGSHSQQVDFSFAVRKSIKSLKDEADELLRTLNPKYGLAQQVSPAFQWAQNDTCIFLTIKYTVRWNAPGALEVTDPSVNMSYNMFNFTALGKHSNLKYKYSLGLKLFDLIVNTTSTWSAASVGKLSVTLRKKWPRKWPRLIADKKAKIGNMHVWMEMQDKLDSTLSGMTTASNSPVTCAAGEKLYCLATDSCKKPTNCSQCPGKTIANEQDHICAGMPTEKASLSFKDEDMDEGELGGEVKINKARNEFDIDVYQVFFGKDERTKLELADGTLAGVGEAAPTGADTSVRIPSNYKLPDGATHLLVFSKNEFGEYATPGTLMLKDAIMPKGKPQGLKFDDEDGEKGEVSGTVTVLRAEDENQIDEYALHWGKSATRKISGASFIRDIQKQAGKDPTHYISSSTKMPDAATHLLAFSKNEHGENPSPASLKLVDNTKPCLNQGDADCPAQVQATPDADPDAKQAQATVSVSAAKKEAGVLHYSLYWGARDCGEGHSSGAKNGHIKDLVVGDSLDYAIPADTPVPDGTTHILAFSKNKYGLSDHCVSTGFEDARDADRKEL
mmetsp:Transcript_10195/g.30256  ORF Transcript_10195/g.30256 Transcript_10195/m.30256 type:complete len:638 (+) Transcript_10195:83-1996(+)